MTRRKTVEPRLRLAGTMVKDGSFWVAEIPSLDVATQGRSQREAFRMVADLLKTMADRSDFRVEVISTTKGNFSISGDVRVLLPLLLRRLRQSQGLSLQQAARMLGRSSPTAIARYERGECLPTWSKFLELFGQLSPERDLFVDIVKRGSTERNT